MERIRPLTLLCRAGPSVARSILAVVAAVALVALLAGLARVAPEKALSSLAVGSLGSRFAVSQTLLHTVPILLTGLAVGWAYRGGLFNIGAEGQFIWGALGAAAIGAYLPVPAWVHIPACLLAGVAAGALWALPAALLKIRRGTPEVVTTLLLNFVALHITAMLANGPLHALNEQGTRTPNILATARLPEIGLPRLHAGLLLAVVIAVGLGILLARGRVGFQLRAAGLNAGTARASGVSVEMVWLRTLLLSGGLAGLAGAIEVLGQIFFFSGGNFPGYGFEGIAVAILGGGGPAGVAAAALFWGALATGAVQMESDTGISRHMVMVIQAVVILAVAVRRWPSLPRRRAGGNSAPVSESA